jgi:RecA/RadA recombinase
MKPFDISKFRKQINKSIPGLSTGFNDPTTWLSTGCYALNYLICGRFDGGIPLEGKFTMFAGDSGSGKSYIVSANIVKDCQKRGVFPVLIDTENAMDESWLHALDVKTEDDDILKISGATIDDVTQMMLAFIDQYKSEHDSKPYAERPKVLIVIDSLGMLISPNNVKQAEEGNMVGDMGIKAKQITHMMRVVLAKIASQPIGLLATNHVMDSQDKYQPDKIPGGKMLEFASSVIVQMNKYLLKEDEDGKALAGGQVAGIRSTSVVRKSRYAKPFERIKIDIPYDKGMDPYSGMFDLILKKGVITKDGVRYIYNSPVTGEVFKEYRKDYRKKGLFDQIIAEWDHWENANEEVGVDDTDGDYEARDDEPQGE